MAVPRNRHSNARKNIRRSHLARTKGLFHNCPNCEKKILSHRICNFCGFYKGKQIVAHEQEEEKQTK